MRHIAVSLLLVVVACSAKKDQAGPIKSVRVAAASDLRDAFADVAKQFEAKTGIKPKFDFGSSGLLAKQIEQGAPFFLFAAANKNFADQVVKAGKCDASTESLYSRGRLVLWSKQGAPAKLEDLVDPKYKRIGIANPDHAPYGKAAQQVMQKAGIYDQVKDRLVLGENIQATMKHATEGAVDVAFVALSLAVATEKDKYMPIDLDLHDPLEQTLVVCGSGPEADNARELAKFIVSDQGRGTMEKYGFSTTGVLPAK